MPLDALTVEVRSNLGGTVIRPFEAGAGAPPWWLRAIAPEFIVRSGDVQLAHTAPAGQPSETAQEVMPVVMVVLGLGLVLLAVYGAVRLARD